MDQVLFWLPTHWILDCIGVFVSTDGTRVESWFADGIPLHAYGLMLFAAFFACIGFATWRARRTGVPIQRETMQDFLIVLFIVGLMGARLVYMWQFNVPLSSFIRIWEGGIVLYGGIIGGTLGGLGFYWFVLRKKGVTLWQLADLSAPTICLGVAIGRIGCLLNGCCYGNVAGEGCAQIDFPLLTSPARDVLVQGDGGDGKTRGSEKRFGLQTSTGFTLETSYTITDAVLEGLRPPEVPRVLSDKLKSLKDKDFDTRQSFLKALAETLDPEELKQVQNHLLRDAADPWVQSVVEKLEPGSAAEAAGMLPGDRIIKFDYGEGFVANGRVMTVSASPEAVDALLEALKSKELLSRVKKIDPIRDGEKTVKIYIDDPAHFRAASDMIHDAASRTKYAPTKPVDTLHDTFISWPRGRTYLQFVVLRDGKEVVLPRFTPRTLGLHPTQLYETISMLLLMGLLLAFYPFRRHNGQVLVLFMAGYAIHRYLNEILRSEPVEGFQMTLSQLISLGVLAGAIALEIYLRWSQPKRGAEPVKPVS